jgi:CPA1 family monovalent cation:H+ antiporter
VHVATLILLVLSVGLASQWLAWRLRIPAIVVLIGAGIVLGPVTGVVDLGLSESGFSELIGLGVAIILFEGGMALQLGELRRVGRGVGRLTVLGPPLAWTLGALAAHYVAGLSWPVAWVLGAILVVTGPTVILPLIRQARLNKDSASLLKWEGIVNDPVGVLLAVLTFQYFTVRGDGVADALAGLAAAVAAAVVLGGAGGWLTGAAFRRGAVPEHLKAPILMVLVLVVYWASNLVQHEAGLLSVTVMGVVLGSMPLVEREALRHFKENLTVVLLSVLFLVIPSQLSLDHLALIDLRAAAFVLAVLFVVRPLAIGIALLGAPVRAQDKVLLAWIAPRGIVAAATASLFGPALVEAGYPDAERLLPFAFLIILATVVAHGFTIGPLTRWLGLAARRANGLLVVGANPWTRAWTQALQKLDVPVLVADGAYARLRGFRMDGAPVFFGEVLSAEAEEELETQHLSHLLCATDNDFYNALVCKAWGARFGHHRTLQLATHQESGDATKRMTLQQRGYLAFDGDADYETLQRRLDEGWTVQTTRLTDAYGIEDLEERLGAAGEAWVLLGGVGPDGGLRLHSVEQPIEPETGWRVLTFAPARRSS